MAPPDKQRCSEQRLTPDTRDLERRGLRLGAGGPGFTEGGLLGFDTLHKEEPGTDEY